MIPKTEQALLKKSAIYCGINLGELADELNIPVPPDLKRDKGWVGMLLETALRGRPPAVKQNRFFPFRHRIKNLTH